MMSSALNTLETSLHYITWVNLFCMCCQILVDFLLLFAVFSLRTCAESDYTLLNLQNEVINDLLVRLQL